MKNHELSAWIRSEKSLDRKKLSYQISPQAMKDLVTVLNDFFCSLCRSSMIRAKA